MEYVLAAFFQDINPQQWWFFAPQRTRTGSVLLSISPWLNGIMTRERKFNNEKIFFKSHLVYKSIFKKVKNEFSLFFNDFLSNLQCGPMLLPGELTSKWLLWEGEQAKVEVDRFQKYESDWSDRRERREENIVCWKKFSGKIYIGNWQHVTTLNLARFFIIFQIFFS